MGSDQKLLHNKTFNSLHGTDRGSRPACLHPQPSAHPPSACTCDTASGSLGAAWGACPHHLSARSLCILQKRAAPAGFVAMGVPEKDVHHQVALFPMPEPGRGRRRDPETHVCMDGASGSNVWKAILLLTSASNTTPYASH